MPRTNRNTGTMLLVSWLLKSMREASQPPTWPAVAFRRSPRVSGPMSFTAFCGDGGGVVPSRRVGTMIVATFACG